jgi:ethanolamine transporter EutH
MNLLQSIIFYLLIGTIWSAIVEVITTKWKVGGDWSNGERIMQIIFWPLFFINFVINFWISFWEGYKDNE